LNKRGQAPDGCAQAEEHEAEPEPDKDEEDAERDPKRIERRELTDGHRARSYRVNGWKK
jgi:hypothetical protein